MPRNSLPEVFFKVIILRSFAKFTGKNMCQNLFLDEDAGCRSATLLKKRLRQVFFCQCCKMFKNAFFTEHPRETASDS